MSQSDDLLTLTPMEASSFRWAGKTLFPKSDAYGEERKYILNPTFDQCSQTRHFFPIAADIYQ